MGRKNLRTKPRSSQGNMGAVTLNPDADEQDRIQRRRIQNRISQQCVRERRLAHAKQLESLKTMIKTSLNPSTATPEPSQNAVLSAQLELTNENKELKDALLRMRKKLLSLSSAAAAAAEDRIFDLVLQKPSAKNAAKEVGVMTEDTEMESEDEEDVNAKETNQGPEAEQPSPTNPALHINQHNVRTRNADIYSGRISNGNTSPEARSISLSSSPESLPSSHLEIIGINELAQTPPTTVTDLFSPKSPQNQDFRGLAVLPFNLSSTSNPTQDWDIFSNVHFFTQTEQNSSPPFFNMVNETWKIEEACLWYLAQKLGITGIDTSRDSPPHERSKYASLRAAIARVDTSASGIVADVAKIGVELMCHRSGFSEYVYGLGADATMEKVFRFRLSNNVRNRANIQEPFCPTQLQLMNTNYPVSIDFLNWPTIRDQCIFKRGEVDVTALVEDIIANTVVEIPEFRAAINVHDAFITRVLRQAAGFGSGNKPHVKIAVSPSIRPRPIFGQTTQDYLFNIDQKVRKLQESRRGSDSNLPTPLLQARSQPLVTKWGLDKIFRWKLSREFAAAHPEIDCMGVTASYPMFASKTLPEMRFQT